MSEIELGATVRVILEGEYQRHCGDSDCEMFRVGGYGVPPGLPVEVLSPPLPPEPPEGAWARFRGDGTWRYVQRLADGWYRDGQVLYLPSPWEDIASLNPEVLAEQPQEKYELATHAEYAKWMHACGHVNGFMHIDPNLGEGRQYSECSRCGRPGEWTPLYRRSSDG